MGSSEAITARMVQHGGDAPCSGGLRTKPRHLALRKKARRSRRREASSGPGAVLTLYGQHLFINLRVNLACSAMQTEGLGLRKDTALIQVHTAGRWLGRKEFTALFVWFRKQLPSQDTRLLPSLPTLAAGSASPPLKS